MEDGGWEKGRGARGEVRIAVRPLLRGLTDKKMEAGSPKSEVGSRKMEDGGWKMGEGTRGEGRGAK